MGAYDSTVEVSAYFWKVKILNHGVRGGHGETQKKYYLVLPFLRVLRVSRGARICFLLRQLQGLY